MRMGYYLLNVTVSGIKNIKKEIKLEFYKKTIDKDFDPNLYRIKAIYGENGSGKSAIITAVKIFQDLIINRNYLNESKNQNFLDEIINKETKEFFFNCEYLLIADKEKIVYNYTVKLIKNSIGLYKIKEEKLMQKNGNYPNNSYKNVFESIDGELVFINAEEAISQYITQKTLNLLDYNSFISTFISNIDKDTLKKNIKDEGTKLVVDIILCLAFSISLNVYLGEEDRHELYFIRKQMRDNDFINKEENKYMSDFLIKMDNYFSVNERIVDKSDFAEYEQKIEKLTRFLKIFKKELVKIDIDKKEDGNRFICELVLDYGNYRVNKEFESTGIKKLIRLFDCFGDASDSGIVFIDEMDSNINDVYLCRIIEYFMYYGNGQLCFTTHNLDPMVVLKDNRNSIDFLSSDNHLVSWTKRGNSTPDNSYRNGMIEDLPFNVDATDFIGIFGEQE